METESPVEKRLIELGWASWVIGLIGSSSLSGFLAQLADPPGAADASDLERFVTAALGGLALTVGIVLSILLLQSGDLQGWALLAGLAACFGLGIAVANGLGIAMVGDYDLIRAASITGGPGPLNALLTFIFACVIAYGVVASLQAAVAGLLLGYWATLLQT